mmetsp:Transcript_37488/g.65042  ORF Transcript_37488/g.65042 Transcript_37488/m.65042 type:complete len:105 (-) Transcript_37488:192-506(-)
MAWSSHAEAAPPEALESAGCLVGHPAQQGRDDLPLWVLVPAAAGDRHCQQSSDEVLGAAASQSTSGAPERRVLGDERRDGGADGSCASLNLPTKRKLVTGATGS